MRKTQKSLIESFSGRRFRRDYEAVHTKARSERVDLGTYSAVRLHKYGVGVPPLWPLAHRPTAVPRGIETFCAMTELPMSVLWAVTADPQRIRVSRHVEFVDQITRVCESVDQIELGRPDSQRYALYLEPVGHILAQCIDTAGFDGQDVGPQRRSHLSGWFPLRPKLDEDRKSAGEAVAPNERREVLVKLSCVAGQQPLVTEQSAAHADDVPTVPTAPTRAELLALFEKFYDHPV